MTQLFFTLFNFCSIIRVWCCNFCFKILFIYWTLQSKLTVIFMTIYICKNFALDCWRRVLIKFQQTKPVILMQKNLVEIKLFVNDQLCSVWSMWISEAYFYVLIQMTRRIVSWLRGLIVNRKIMFYFPLNKKIDFIFSLHNSCEFISIV